MSTKTIALDAGVYEKLARLKGESQSFSKLISSLVDRVVTAHTVADVLAQLDDEQPLRKADAETMARLVREDRETETWPSHDLS
jgi:predicted CopG family antitoxin